MDSINQNQGAAEAAPSRVGREKLVKGFDYKRGVGVVKTRTEWRALLLTHDRRVENGETFFRNRVTKRTEYEAYANITEQNQGAA